MAGLCPRIHSPASKVTRSDIGKATRWWWRQSDIRDGLWLDLKGDPLTSAGRTLERIRRPNYGTPEIELTVDDPKVYARPWQAKRYLKIALDTELIEDICNENEKSFVHMVGK